MSEGAVKGGESGREILYKDVGREKEVDEREEERERDKERETQRKRE